MGPPPERGFQAGYVFFGKSVLRCQVPTPAILNTRSRYFDQTAATAGVVAASLGTQRRDTSFFVKVFCDAKSAHPLSWTPEADILTKQLPQPVWCTFWAPVYVLCKYQQHHAACNIYSAFAFIVQSSKKTQKFVLRATPTRCNVLAKASCGCTVQDESWK